MEHRQSLSLPLLSATAAVSPASSSNPSIAVRLLLVAVIGLTSLWANHEASKGFEITILNDAKSSPAGQRFHLFYVSNDEATRLLLNATDFIHTLIYPSDPQPPFPIKPIERVHLTLSPRDLPSNVAVDHGGGRDFVLHLSSSIFSDKNVNRAMSAAVFRGMSRVLLWDGEAHAPPALLAGMVEYIVAAAGFAEEKYSGAAVSMVPPCDPTWWKDRNPTEVALFLDHHERQRKGFIQRLNRGLKSRWHDRTVEDALGVPAQRPCGLFNSSKITM